MRLVDYVPNKFVSWQYENCLACKWFRPADPINADIFERGACVEPSLKKFNLVISGRDWCNKYAQIDQKQIDKMQEKAMSEET
jgi:hypothetical protein